MKDTIRTEDISGHITILCRERGKNWEVLVDKKNALVPNAALIIASALAGDTGWVIDNIRAYKASAPLAASTTTFSYPAPGKVKFETIFSFSSFNDTLDELRLLSATGGDFSVVTGLSVNKPNTLELSVQWVLTVI